MAEEIKRFRIGEDIFRHEWTYESRSLKEQGLPERTDFRDRRSLQGDGLGPMHNATSCESCHEHGGGAGVDRNVTLLTLDPRNRLTSKASKETRQELIDLYPGLLSPRGVLSMEVVVHEKSTRPFFDMIRNSIANHIPGGAVENWFVSDRRTVDAIAKQPVLAGRLGDLDFYLSQRNSPALHGAGLIDRIDGTRLTAIARAQWERTGGRISGRVGNGKFGWRAQTRTLAQFVRGACAAELGLQLRGTPQPADVADETYRSFGTDLSEHEVNMLVSYVSALRRPAQETGFERDPVARHGKELFTKIGCADCHHESIHSAIGIFSDLLLHDMGELLQAPSPAPVGQRFASSQRLPLPRFTPEGLRPSSLDRQSALPRPNFFPSSGYHGGGTLEGIPMPFPMARPDHPQFPRGNVPESVASEVSVGQMTWDALQREWRTPPLWGVADSAPYLHDGRASTLDAAIRWHGGEASLAIRDYEGLTDEKRDHLIRFLKTLRAPPARPVRKLFEAAESTESSLVAAELSEAQLQKMAEAIDVFAP